MTEAWMIDELAHAGPEHLDPEFVAGYNRKQGYPDPAEDLAIFQAHGLEDGQVLGRVGIALLAVIACDELGVEVFGSRVRQFVDYPGLGHDVILLAPATRFPALPGSTDTV